MGSGRRVAIVVSAVLTGLTAALAGSAFLVERRDPAPLDAAVGLASPAVAVRPTASASPKQYLTRTYSAPRRLVAPGAGGVLRIPDLGIEAPVDSVGLDGSVMAIPDDVGRVGWLTATAASRDLSGASVISGHVSDRRDRPGVLWDLHEVTEGDRIEWTDKSGRTTTFIVTALATYPRVEGLPAAMFRTDGAHVLHLVTCADRRATPGGGFHYAANLVVTARVSGGRP